MNNLNDTIFGTVKANFMELSTRVLFPDTYDEITQRIIAEYGQTVLKVIKDEDVKRYGEASFKAEEEGYHVCGMSGPFYRSCKHYYKEFSVEARIRTRRRPLMTEEHLEEDVVAVEAVKLALG